MSYINSITESNIKEKIDNYINFIEIFLNYYGLKSKPDENFENRINEIIKLNDDIKSVVIPDASSVASSPVASSPVVLNANAVPPNPSNVNDNDKDKDDDEEEEEEDKEDDIIIANAVHPIPSNVNDNVNDNDKDDDEEEEEEDDVIFANTVPPIPSNVIDNVNDNDKDDDEEEEEEESGEKIGDISKNIFDYNEDDDEEDEEIIDEEDEYKINLLNDDEEEEDEDEEEGEVINTEVLNEVKDEVIGDDDEEEEENEGEGINEIKGEIVEKEEEKGECEKTYNNIKDLIYCEILKFFEKFEEIKRYYKIDEYVNILNIDGVRLSNFFNIFRVFSNNYLIIYNLYIKDKEDFDKLQNILEYIKSVDETKIASDDNDLLRELHYKLKELINILP